MNKKILIVSITFLLWINGIGLLASSQENTNKILYVGGTGDGNYSSIMGAVDESASGDTIFIYNNIYVEQVLITKSLNIKGEDKYNTIIDGNFLGNTIYIASDNVTLEEISIRNSGNYTYEETNKTGSNTSSNGGGGIQIVEGVGVSDDILTMTIDYAGVFSDSNNIHISSCIIEQNYVGILMRNGSNNQVNDCLIQENNDGLNFYYGNNYVVKRNVLSDNINGMYLYEMYLSDIAYCSITANTGNGMTIAASEYNQFYMNDITNNSIGVIIINDCIGNMFYQNNFNANSMTHVRDVCMNIWDNGIVGNYWDDYMGIDADADGIGDSSYEIQMYSTDNYPYINPISTLTPSSMVIMILSPTNDEKVSDTILIKGTVIDEKEIIEVSIRIDDTEWVSVEGLEAWELSLNTSIYENGLHTLFVSAINSDDVSAVNHISFSIENLNETNNEKPVIDDTPGFTVLFVLISILMVLFIVKRKKF